MKNFPQPLFRFLISISLLIFVFLQYSCETGSGVENGTFPYETKYFIKVLDLETGKERVLGEGRNPRISPLSDKIFFSDKYGLCCINTDSTGFLRLISSTSYLQTYNFSPDGKKLAVRLVESTGTYTWANNLYIVNSDGSGMTKILSYNPPFDPSPVFSPAMDKVVFTNPRDIVSVDLQGKNYTTIKTSNDTSYFNSIHFLPGDNDRLIYIEVVQNRNRTITYGKYLKVYSISSGKETLIGKFDTDRDLEFSENGKVLLTYFRNSWQTSILDISRNFLLSDILKGYSQNSISADGSKVVSSNLKSIHLMNSDVTDARTVLVLKDSVHAESPRITRDGRHIIYQYNNYYVLKDSY